MTGILYWFLLIFLFYRVEPNHTDISSYQENIVVAASETREVSLCCLIIGDWGKGGENGKTASVVKSRPIPTIPQSETNSNLTRLEPANVHPIIDGDRIRNSDIGTLGGGGTNQLAIAAEMADYADSASCKPEFVIALGDNFYTKGVYSTTDSLWTYLWSNIYLKYDSLNIPWYAVLGNHDYGYGSTGVRAQVDKTKEGGLWHMPSMNYTMRFDFPSGCGSVRVVFIDTTTLAPSVNSATNSQGGISSTVQAERIKSQLTNINRILEDATEDPSTWLLVAGHYPIFSAGEHSDTSELKKYLLPLLSAYNVHAYFAGHDHISEHLYYGDMHHFIVGAGALTGSLSGSTSAKLLWAGAGYSAFGAMKATESDLTISFIDSSGNKKYSYTLTNPTTGICEPTGIPTSAPSKHHTNSGSGGSSGRNGGYSSSLNNGLAMASNEMSHNPGIAACVGIIAAAFLMVAGTFFYRRRQARKGLISSSRSSRSGTSRTGRGHSRDRDNGRDGVRDNKGRDRDYERGRSRSRSPAKQNPRHTKDVDVGGDGGGSKRPSATAVTTSPKKINAQSPLRSPELRQLGFLSFFGWGRAKSGRPDSVRKGSDIERGNTDVGKKKSIAAAKSPSKGKRGPVKKVAAAVAAVTSKWERGRGGINDTKRDGEVANMKWSRVGRAEKGGGDLEEGGREALLEMDYNDHFDISPTIPSRAGRLQRHQFGLIPGTEAELSGSAGSVRPSPKRGAASHSMSEIIIPESPASLLAEFKEMDEGQGREVFDGEDEDDDDDDDEEEEEEGMRRSPKTEKRGRGFSQQKYRQTSWG